MAVKNRQSLLDADIARALTRKHKRCKEHGDVQVVCLACARVFCPRCSATCPRCLTVATVQQQEQKTQTKTRIIISKAPVYAPPPLPTEPRLREIQLALQPFQVRGIERHTDSGEWMAVFPYRVNGYNTASDLADQVYRLIKDRAVPTSYGSGRLFKPDRWFVSFRVRPAG